MREDLIRAAIENLSPDRFERFAYELLSRTLYPGLNPTSSSADLGEDARTEPTTTFLHNDKHVSLAISKTATIAKLREDCQRCRQTDRQIDVIVFATAGSPQTRTEDRWRNEVEKEHGWELEVRTIRWLAPTAGRPQHESLVDDYLQVPPPDGDFVQTIETQFACHTEHALKRINRLIPGIDHPFARPELERIEAQLGLGNPVVLTGDAGSGKSGIAATLAEAATNKGMVVLLLDARRVGHVRNEAHLRQHLPLNGPVAAAVQRVGKYKGCRFIIDQLDSIAGQPSAQVLADLAAACVGPEGVETIVISRKREHHEACLLDHLANQGFREITSFPLNETSVTDALSQIGIFQPSDDLLELGRNLLNLELIASIRQQRPGFDFSNVLSEVDLWEQYIEALIQREKVGSDSATAEQIIAEAAELARYALSNPDRVVELDYPRSHVQQRLISWQVLEIEYGDNARFRHDQFQSYLYAWRATQRGAMPLTVLGEIQPHASRNVIVWMDKIYARSGSPKRQQFLKEAFNV